MQDKKLCIQGLFYQFFMPNIPAFDLTATAKGSVANVKSNGERVHPCHIDCCKLTSEDQIPRGGLFVLFQTNI